MPADAAHPDATNAARGRTNTGDRITLPRAEGRRPTSSSVARGYEDGARTGPPRGPDPYNPAMAANGDRGIELAELVRQLRQELRAAAAEGAQAGDALQFEVGPVEVEATVAVSREGGAHGKVRFWVVEAGADGKAARSTTQRLKLTLHPKAVAQDGTTRSPLISGDEVDGER